ncbi:membrane protein [Bacteroidia bacterium]|nr:membrane protein [Bacteroidia bacterium]
MDKKNFAFDKLNYIICAVSVLLIVTGFILMTGSSSSVEGGFEPDIFSTKRIVVAPMVCFAGFLLMIVGILYPGKKRLSGENEA